MTKTETGLLQTVSILVGVMVGGILAYFYNIIPFPNTELFEWIRVNGNFLKTPDDYLNDFPILDNDPVFETPQMPLKIRIAYGTMKTGI